MNLLKRIPINSDTNLYAINGIVVPSANFYIDVVITSNGREVKIPVRSNPHVEDDKRLHGVYYRMNMPVLACHPVSDTEFYTEVGQVDVAAAHLRMSHQKSTHWAYMGALPDVAESDVRDKRYVTPMTVYQVPPRPDLPKHFRHVKSYGATIHADYLRTSAIDSIDDELWEQLRNIDPQGYKWSDFLEQATRGRFTVIEDLSQCLIDIDAEYVPDAVVRRLMLDRFEKRMRG